MFKYNLNNLFKLFIALNTRYLVSVTLPLNLAFVIICSFFPMFLSHYALGNYHLGNLFLSTSKYTLKKGRVY